MNGLQRGYESRPPPAQPLIYQAFAELNLPDIGWPANVRQIQLCERLIN